jgi:hypothetical protein
MRPIIALGTITQALGKIIDILVIVGKVVKGLPNDLLHYKH